MQPSLSNKNGLDLAAKLAALINKKSNPAPSVPASTAGHVHQANDVRPMASSDVCGDVRPQPLSMSEIMLAAINNVKKTVPTAKHAQINNLYLAWLNDLQTATDDHMLTARGSIAWVKHNAAKQLSINVSYAAIDAISDLFRAKAMQAGVIELNPDYNGKPPFPRYRRTTAGGGEA